MTLSLAVCLQLIIATLSQTLSWSHFRELFAIGQAPSIEQSRLRLSGGRNE